MNVDSVRVFEWNARSDDRKECAGARALDGVLSNSQGSISRAQWSNKDKNIPLKEAPKVQIEMGK